MRNSSIKSVNVEKLVYAAVLTALVVVLQFIPIRFGTFELALSVPIIVVGAAICGATVGAWLGFVFGFVVLFLPGTALYMGIDVFGTIVTVLAKGVLAGLLSGLAYRVAVGTNRYVACFIAAIIATVVNTAVFILGSYIFFDQNIFELLKYLISINFAIELVANVVLVPTIYRIISIKRKI